LTGTAHRIAGSDDETGTATLKVTALGDSSVELSFPSGNRIEIRNHSALPLAGSVPANAPSSLAQIPQPVGEWIGVDGVAHPMAGHNIMTDAAWFFPALALERIASGQNYVLSYVGQETREGTAVLHVSASEVFSQLPQSLAGNPSGPGSTQFLALIQHLSRMDFYLDPNSLLPVTLDFDCHPDNDALIDIATEIVFSDYLKTGGIAIPLHVQKYLNNGLVLDLQFTGTTLNSGLSASAFALQ
jgi:hypothetical protein